MSSPMMSIVRSLVHAVCECGIEGLDHGHRLEFAGWLGIAADHQELVLGNPGYLFPCRLLLGMKLFGKAWRHALEHGPENRVTRR